MQKRIARKVMARYLRTAESLEYRNEQSYHAGKRVSLRQLARLAGNPSKFADLVVPNLDDVREEVEELESERSWTILDPDGNAISGFSGAEIPVRDLKRYPESEGYRYVDNGPSRYLQSQQARLRELKEKWEDAYAEWDTLTEPGELEYRYRSYGDEFEINLVEDGVFRAGNIYVFHLQPSQVEELSPECRMHLDKAQEKLGFVPEVYMVYSSALVEELRGHGIGTALYVRAAKEAADRNGVLIPDMCHPHFGSTSDAALRVWSGSGFASQVRMLSKWVAWGG